jgi:hypothetical protein
MPVSRDPGPDRLLRPFVEDPRLGRARVRARVTCRGRTLALSYAVDQVPARIVLPAPGAGPGRQDGLWQHTCFEAFVAPRGAPGYWEINLSPSGSWNVYRFTGYRDGMVPEERIGALSDLRAAVAGDTLQVEATCDIGGVPELAAAHLEVGLASVLEAEDGSLSYWALHHPGPTPDFHLRAGCVITLRPEERA